MRVLIIKSNFVYPLYSGTAILTYNLITVLSKHHEVVLVSMVNSKKDLVGSEHLRKLGVEVHTVLTPYNRSFIHKIVYKGLRWLKRYFRGIPKEVEYANPINYRVLIEDVLSRYSYDLVQIDYWYSAQLVNLVRKVPVVLFTHGVKSDLLFQVSAASTNALKKFLGNEKAKIVARYEERYFQKFDRIVNLTDRDTKIFRQRFPSQCHKIETIPYIWRASHEKKEKRSMSLGMHSLIMVGDMNHDPNVDAVLYFVNDILPTVEEQIPDVLVYVVGKNPRKEVRNLARRKNVKVTGIVPDVYPFIRSASAYLCPMRQIDGIKNKLLEAMYFEKPIVASEVATLGYGVRNGQELLLASSPEDFARKVVRVLKDESLDERLGKNARNYVRRCHMGPNVEKLILQKYEEWAKVGEVG